MSDRVFHVALDSQIRVRQSEAGIDVRVFRRSVADVSSTAFHPTAYGLHIPPHRAEEIADAIRDVAAAMAAPAGQG